MVIALLAGMTALAGNDVARAGSAAQPANQAGTAQIEAYVWNDVDQDGVQDEDELGIPFVTVNLYDSANALVDTTVTEANGQYLFRDLTPGEYFVEFMLPTGFTFSPQDRGGDEALDSDAYRTTGKTIKTELLAGQNNPSWDAGMYQLPSFFGHPKRGTVKPPPRVVRTCREGNYSVGGVSGLKVHRLERGYCLQAFLWKHFFPFGRIPDGAGKILAPITFIQYFRFSRFIHKVPDEDGDVEICYAVPADKEAKIYFYNFHGARFGDHNKKRSWEPLETTIENGMACAKAQTSGAYALIGK